MISRALATASLKPVVLSILKEADSYGYQIIQNIEQVSDGELHCTTGTLYPFLHGLENAGLVASYWQEVENAPKRKYYRLTYKGEEALTKEQQEWLNVNRIFVKLWGPSTKLAWS